MDFNRLMLRWIGVIGAIVLAAVVLLAGVVGYWVRG